jgi:hypothetical protein
MDRFGRSGSWYEALEVRPTYAALRSNIGRAFSVIDPHPASANACGLRRLRLAGLPNAWVMVRSCAKTADSSASRGRNANTVKHVQSQDSGHGN